jgi:heme/copper-type cytochrome/quinol oxidase subunit 2/plastocyanin
VFLLAIIAVPTVAGIRDLGREPSDEALEVRVEAFRFSWQFFYREIKVGDEELESLPDDDSDQRPVLRIPVDREIAIRLISKDVNHSFWIPKLAGKTDVIQNHENKMWILATEPGLFEAQCAEFCGLSHSDMRFRVEAMPEAEFNAWVEEQGGVETLGSADSTAADDNEVEGTPGPVTPPPTDAIILDDNFVHLQGQSEENPTITVPSGKTVAVVNEGAALHNLQVSPFESAICTLDDPSPCSDPPRISGGDEGTITFDIPAGNYEYRCDFHPVEMTGTLVVGPPEPTGSDEPAPGGVASDSEAEEPAGD